MVASSPSASARHRARRRCARRHAGASGERARRRHARGRALRRRRARLGRRALGRDPRRRAGGRTWKQQRLDLAHDRPFAVHFLDAQHGVAVGLWSLVLVTEDGGATWQERKLDVPPGAKKADLNLLGLFAGRGRAALRHRRARPGAAPDDRGQTWRYLATGYRGSLWCGTALADGTLIVGGQRGSMWRAATMAARAGPQWPAAARVPSPPSPPTAASPRSASTATPPSAPTAAGAS
ncbi:MAG: YCF48-related protein [Rubrivivax sp.]